MPGNNREERFSPAGVLSDPSGNVEIVIKGTRFTEDDAEAHIHGICFKTGPPERVGVELEWLVRDRRDTALPVQAEQVAATPAPFGGAGPTGDGVSRRNGRAGPQHPTNDRDDPGQAPMLVRDLAFPSLPS